MRAALHEWWPALTERFGIRPPDADLYSEAELLRYVDRLKAQHRPTPIERKSQRG